MKKQIITVFGKKHYLLGADASGTKYYLQKAKFDCGWYWGGGYVETFTNNHSPEKSRELMLYAINNGELYRRQITPVINSLRKKAVKGTYDSDKAVDAWYYVACSASQMYDKDFGYSFTVADRFTAAVELEKYFKEDVEQ